MGSATSNPDTGSRRSAPARSPRPATRAQRRHHRPRADDQRVVGHRLGQTQELARLQYGDAADLRTRRRLRDRERQPAYRRPAAVGVEHEDVRRVGALGRCRCPVHTIRSKAGASSRAKRGLTAKRTVAEDSTGDRRPGARARGPPRPGSARTPAAARAGPAARSIAAPGQRPRRRPSGAAPWRRARSAAAHPRAQRVRVLRRLAARSRAAPRARWADAGSAAGASAW